METYSLLREVADSWVLLAMFGFFYRRRHLGILTKSKQRTFRGEHDSPAR